MKFPLSFKYDRPSVSCTKKEEYPDKFSYVKFCFGILDCDGLSKLLIYHECTALKKKIAEEKAWLNQSKTNLRWP